MILFGFPYVQDGVQALYEIVIKMVCTSGVFPEQICELNGIAQRVDLIFAFPEPIAHFRLIVIPAVAVFFLIEGICIGIMVYKEKLSSFQARREKEGAGVKKRDVQRYLKQQQKEANEPVNNAFAQALAGLKLD